MLGPAPERRTRRDLVVVVVIVAVLALAATVVWWRSDARATTSVTATQPLPALAEASGAPTSLSPVWSAPSAVTPTPLVVGGAVVTADGGLVEGRDPRTGDVAWSYRRDLPLCAVSGQWSRVVAVFRDTQGCSEVTSLRADTGERAQQRSGAADDAITLRGDGTYLTAAGDTRLETWRSDLVRTLEYGRVETPVAPDNQPRTGCTLHSTASTPARVSVVESCPGDPTDRLSLLDAAPSDSARPQEQGSVLLPGRDSRLLAVGPEVEAVLVPDADGGPQVVLHDGAGALVERFAAPVAAEELTGPRRSTPEVVTTPAVVTVVVGSTLLALDPTTLTLRWSTQGVLGPGVLVRDTLLVPTDGAVTPLDATTGAVGTPVPVDRGSHRGPVALSAAGDVIIEQRGDGVTALR